MSGDWKGTIRRWNGEIEKSKVQGLKRDSRRIKDLAVSNEGEKMFVFIVCRLFSLTEYARWICHGGSLGRR